MRPIFTFFLLFVVAFSASCSRTTDLGDGGDDISTPLDANDFDLSFYDAKTKAAIPDSGVNFSLGEEPEVLSTVTHTGTKSVTLSKRALTRSNVVTAKQRFSFSNFASLSALGQLLGFGSATRSDLRRFGRATFLGCWTSADHSVAIDTTTDSIALPAQAVCDFQFKIVANSPLAAEVYSVNINLGGTQKKKSLTLTARPLVFHTFRLSDFEDDYFAISSNTTNISKSFQFRRSPNGETSTTPVTFSVEQPISALLTATPNVSGPCEPAPGATCDGTLSISFAGAQPTEDVRNYPVTLVAKEGDTVIGRRTFLVQIFKDAIPLELAASKLNAVQLEKARYVSEQDLTDPQGGTALIYVIGDGKLWYSIDRGLSFHVVLKPTLDGGVPTPFTGVTAYTSGATTQEVIIAHAGGVHAVNIRQGTMYPISGLPEDDRVMVSLTARVPNLDEVDALGNFGGANPLSTFHSRFFMLSAKGNIYVALRAPGNAGVFAIDRSYVDMDKIKEQILSSRAQRADLLPKFLDIHYVGGGGLMLTTEEGLVALKTDDNTTLTIDKNLFNADSATALGPLLYSADRSAPLPEGCSFSKIKSIIRTFTSDGIHLAVTTTPGTGNDCTVELRRKFFILTNIDFELADRAYSEKFFHIRTFNHNAGDFAGLEILGFYSNFNSPNTFMLVMRNIITKQIKFFAYDPNNDATAPTLIEGPVLDENVVIPPGALFVFSAPPAEFPAFSAITVDTNNLSTSTYTPRVSEVPPALEGVVFYDYVRTSVSNGDQFTPAYFIFKLLSPQKQTQIKIPLTTLTMELNTFDEDNLSGISSDVFDLNIKRIVEPFGENFALALLGGIDGGNLTRPDIALLNSNRTNLDGRLEGGLAPVAADYNNGDGFLYVGVDGDHADVGGIYKIERNNLSNSSRIIALEDSGFNISSENRKISLVKIINDNNHDKRFLILSVIGKLLVLDLANTTIDNTTVQSIDFTDNVTGQSAISAELLPEDSTKVLLTFSNGQVRTLTLSSDNSYISNSTIELNTTFDSCLGDITAGSPRLTLTRARTPDNSIWFTFFSNNGACVFHYTESWGLHIGPLVAPTGGIKQAILEKTMLILLPETGFIKIIPIPETYSYEGPPPV